MRWLVRCEAALPEHDRWLAPAEQETLARLRTAKRRREWRLGRWTAKQALAIALPALPGGLARLAIHAAADGAPEALVDGAPAPVVLSLSHRDGHACCALAPAGTALGCDLERVAARRRRLLAGYLAADEAAWVETAPAAARALRATLVWSAKESALKALRAGLRLDPRALRVRLANAAPVAEWRALAVAYPAAARIFHGWWRRHGGLVLTIVARPPSAPVALRGRATAV